MSDTRGFSLVEVLVALVILNLSLLAMASSFVHAYQGVARNRERTTAVVLCQDRMEWLRAQPSDSTALTAGSVTEILVSDYAGFSRTTSIVHDTPRVGVKQVTVVTTGPSGRTVETVSLIEE